MRLTANDSALSGFDEVSVTVLTGNGAPVITSTPVTRVAFGGPGPSSNVTVEPTWTISNYEFFVQPDAAWSVNGTKTVINQSVDCDPSIYVSDVPTGQERIVGDIKTLGADDDFIGFVFGYQDASHFYVFDWKGGSQVHENLFAEKGMSLKVVDAATPLTIQDLWPTAGNGSRVRTLYHNTIAWSNAYSYRFVLDYRPGQITVTVFEMRQPGVLYNTLTSFTVSDSRYPSGRFGFYNYSQAATTYSGFSRATLAGNTYSYDVEATDPNGDPIGYNLLQGPAGMQLDPVTGLLQWPLSVASIGTYQVTVRAQDPQGLFAQQSYTLTVDPDPANQPPAVYAGFDHTLFHPQNVSVLAAEVTDDGLPQGAALFYEWSKLSGPGNANFVDTRLPNTQVTFSSPGTYVLRLTASDTQHIRTDEVTIRVLPQSGPNLAPVVNAGPDQTAALRLNLLANGSAEQPTPQGAPSSWPTLAGTWSASPGSIIPFEGQRLFRVTSAGAAEVFQEVDVSAFAAAIDAGTLSFTLGARVWSPAQTDPDRGQIRLEYLSAPGADPPLAVVGTPAVAGGGDWVSLEDARPAPAGTRAIRVYLRALPGDPAATDVAFDAVSLRADAAAVRLTGSVLDDQRPSNAIVTNQWSSTQAPAAVLFQPLNQPATAAVMQAAGAYTLRLSANDTQLTGSDELQVVVQPPNQPPVIDVGRDLTVGQTGVAITLPGAVTDADGGPSAPVVRWRQVSGPAAATFTTSGAVTQASFPANGSYLLRVVASDGDQSSTRTLGVLVDDTGQNRAPFLSAGPDRLIALPNSTAQLDGWVSDDGLPTASVSQIWSKVSGPGIVNFSNGSAASTQASFIGAGVYVLRLTASDGLLSARDEVVVSVSPEDGSNLPPLSDAGPDQTISLPEQTVTMSGRAADDARPVGSTLSSSWTKNQRPGRGHLRRRIPAGHHRPPEHRGPVRLASDRLRRTAVDQRRRDRPVDRAQPGSGRQRRPGPDPDRAGGFDHPVGHGQRRRPSGGLQRGHAVGPAIGSGSRQDRPARRREHLGDRRARGRRLRLRASGLGWPAAGDRHRRRDPQCPLEPGTAGQRRTGPRDRAAQSHGNPGRHGHRRRPANRRATDHELGPDVGPRPGPVRQPLRGQHDGHVRYARYIHADVVRSRQRAVGLRPGHRGGPDRRFGQQSADGFDCEPAGSRGDNRAGLESLDPWLAQARWPGAWKRVRWTRRSSRPWQPATRR